MKFRSIMAMFLLLALLVTTVACKKNKTTEEESTGLDFELDTSDGYDYGKLDCEGGTFTLLQCDEGRWNMKTALVPAEFTGDEITDADPLFGVKTCGGLVQNENFGFHSNHTCNSGTTFFSPRQIKGGFI